MIRRFGLAIKVCSALSWLDRRVHWQTGRDSRRERKEALSEKKGANDTGFFWAFFFDKTFGEGEGRVSDELRSKAQQGFHSPKIVVLDQSERRQRTFLDCRCAIRRKIWCVA
ncbi:hypothetical protein U1Q18_030113 [Sarracenia purpurea var. burkii]